MARDPLPPTPSSHLKTNGCRIQRERPEVRKYAMGALSRQRKWKDLRTLKRIPEFRARQRAGRVKNDGTWIDVPVRSTPYFFNIYGTFRSQGPSDK